MSNDDGHPLSYRDVGIKPTGSLTRGSPRHNKTPLNDKKVCSIPSKIETTLNDTAGGPNAFWSRTQRFNEAENALPGPGAYYKLPSFVRSANICGSVSRLGYGVGFVSKSDRFGKSLKDILPGPGQYNSGALGSVCTRKPQSSNANARQARKMIPTNQQPGPGAYNTTETTFSSPSAAYAAFSSKVNRSRTICDDIPAPGQYKVETPETKLPMHSVFRSKARRIEDLMSESPGPGAYKTEQAEICMRYDTVAKVHPNAIFHKSTKDRFSELNRPEETAIGPGHYDTFPYMKQLGSTKMRSMQVERRDRWSTDRPQDVPGPAYYRPSFIPKQSHNSNADRKWL
ncbi:unnamed protein product [Albugo candida]|uniref:Uncharacterized protein n=1 Tax=Albugo candida TaxID=65357 RepID=A0A024G4D5_9STRA|nr:unnamed protein product [Albugo candida]|eukprot:CCI41377.1 unnamed protein product [Albugo candida]